MCCPNKVCSEHFLLNLGSKMKQQIGTGAQVLYKTIDKGCSRNAESTFDHCGYRVFNSSAYVNLVNLYKLYSKWKKISYMLPKQSGKKPMD